MRINYPVANKDLLLQLAVKAMKDILEPEGIVPSSLVFGELPRIYTRSEIQNPRDYFGERAKMVHTAGIEMDLIMAKMRTAGALKHAVPASADIVFDHGDQVLVWREKVINHRIGE